MKQKRQEKMIEEAFVKKVFVNNLKLIHVHNLCRLLTVGVRKVCDVIIVQ
jgi:hypothetical protein